MVNIYSTDWDGTQDHPGYEWNRIRLGRRLGGEMLGASIYVLESGQRSFPYHFHQWNDLVGINKRDARRSADPSLGLSFCFATNSAGHNA